MSENIKKAGAYIRVSTEEQVNSGTSLKMQEERTVSQIGAKGWELYKVYNDGGYSGGNTDRPALQEMIQDMRDGKIDAVVIYKLDRLSRNLRDTLNLLEEEFFKNEVEIVSVVDSIDTSSPMGKAMINVTLTFAQLERDTITDRTSAGRAETAKTGQWSGGRIPYGYRIENKQLQIIPEEAVVIRKVFELNKVKDNPHQIMEAINDLGFRTRNDKMFSRTHIANMLKNEYLYRGRYKYGSGEEVNGQHEPILK